MKDHIVRANRRLLPERRRNDNEMPHSGYVIYKDGSRLAFDVAEDPQASFKIPFFNQDGGLTGIAAGVVVWLPKFKEWVAKWTTHTGGQRMVYHTDLEEVIAEMGREQREELEYLQQLDTDPTFALEEALKSHDWYSAFSDDASYWHAGERSWDRILKLKAMVPVDTWIALYDKYAPKVL